MRNISVDGVELWLCEADTGEVTWLDYNGYEQQLEAAWLRLSAREPALNPRLIGAPGLGKTTLARAVGRRLGREVYIFQCTTDTRPEDLLVTPVLAADGRIIYRASSLVTAMVRGGVLVLDEANRMPERSWAALAPLLDDRRTIDSLAAGVRIRAHAEFRLCVTMNDDASTYDLPGYIQSRLKPRIEIVPPGAAMQERIVRHKAPDVDADLLDGLFNDLLKRASDAAEPTAEPAAEPTPRDLLNLAFYAQKLRRVGFEEPLQHAARQVLGGYEGYELADADGDLQSVLEDADEDFEADEALDKLLGQDEDDD
jgi:MoxR-like ATPase